MKRVRLLVPCDQWPAGTVGTVIQETADYVFIDVKEDGTGMTLDLLTVDHDQVEAA